MSNARLREFDFTDQDFQRIRKLISERAGISLGESKQELVYSRLARRVRASGVTSFSAYLDRLQSGNAAEWEAFTNALTTNLTSFFREPHHFPILAEHLRKQESARQLTLWCSACSTGEEAYSMAITAVETLGNHDRVHIIASDLDTKELQTAREGLYKADAVARLPQQQVERFFVPGTGDRAGYMQVKPELKRMIDFRCINLLHQTCPD